MSDEKKKPKQKQTQYILYTCFDMTTKPHETMKMDNIKYHRYQLEQCPDTGKYHWQGCFITKQKISAPTVYGIGCKPAQLILNRGTPHVEEMRNLKAVIAYVTKDKTSVKDKEGNKIEYTFGELKTKKEGRSTTIVKSLQEGKSIQEIILSEPTLVLNTAALARAQALLAPKVSPKREKPRTVLWVWGPSGTGKTSQVFSVLNYEFDQVNISTSKYEILKVTPHTKLSAVIDEVGPDSIDRQVFNKFTDPLHNVGFPQLYTRETVMLPYDIIIFTSNYSPRECIRGYDDSCARRIKEVYIGKIGDKIPQEVLSTPPSAGI